MTIPSFKKGSKLWAADLQSLADAVRANRVLPGAGIRITGGLNGTTVAADIPRSGADAAARHPFQLVVTTDPADKSDNPAPKIRVRPSTLAGGSSTDLGFSEGDDPGYYLDPAQGVLVGGITFNTGTGEITSRWLEIKGEFPNPDEVADGTDYVEIGSVAWNNAKQAWIVSNSRYGPIEATICRNWFAAEAPYFGVNWITSQPQL